jgi:hypothetical protein
MDDRPDWCTCEHGFGAHEFGLCQTVIGEHGPSPTEVLPPAATRVATMSDQHEAQDYRRRVIK